MRDSAYAGFENISQKLWPLLLRAFAMIAVVIAPAIVATMIEAGKTAINESRNHLHNTSRLPKKGQKIGLPGGELILSIVLPLSIRIFLSNKVFYGLSDDSFMILYRIYNMHRCRISFS
jgi:hypothetical protein